MDYLIPVLILVACCVLWCVLGGVVLFLADDDGYTLLSYLSFHHFLVHSLLLFVWPLVLMVWGVWCYSRARRDRDSA